MAFCAYNPLSRLKEPRQKTGAVARDLNRKPRLFIQKGGRIQVQENDTGIATVEVQIAEKKRTEYRQVDRRAVCGTFNNFPDDGKHGLEKVRPKEKEGRSRLVLFKQRRERSTLLFLARGTGTARPSNQGTSVLRDHDVGWPRASLQRLPLDLFHVRVGRAQLYVCICLLHKLQRLLLDILSYSTANHLPASVLHAMRNARSKQFRLKIEYELHR